MTTAALIVAAGRGERAGGAIPKQYRPLAGRPVIAHAVAVLADHSAIDLVRVVYNPGDEAEYRAATADFSLLEPVAGGASRQRSVLNGLASLDDIGVDRVLIHDAARPLLSHGLVSRLVAALETDAAVVPALAVADTLKRAADGVVSATVDRGGLYRAQTPQAFHFGPILAAHRARRDKAFTDDAAIAEAVGLKVRLIEGEEMNFKITTTADFARAEALLAGDRRFDTRTGSGFDVHRFRAGDRVTLCGVEIAHSHALEGHSDADVGLHAITDALLGAGALGDIGQHFPPSDERWRGADSAAFLAHAAALLRERGGEIVNIDLTLICERPKIGPHRAAMTSRVADILAMEGSRISIKATTTEGLGFTGRREGIAGQAIATVRMPR